MRKAFITPTKYVQGEDELLNLGYFVKQFGDKALLIADPFALDLVKDKLDETAKTYEVEFVISDAFKGECCRSVIAELQKIAIEKGCACTIGLGGGKAIDTSKCVAAGNNLIICPTIAATDAPTSHSAVVYTEDHLFEDYAYFKQSPSVILIDTTVIVNAPTRFLVSGMGDALATYFEARANERSFSNVNAGLPCGADRSKGTLLAYGTDAAMALATLCYENLKKYGSLAKTACDSNTITPAFEKIVETNILLSGLGFESGGLAAAHAIVDGLTLLPAHHKYYHGEMVAFSTICQLVLENAPKEELYEVIDFCLEIGLPVCLADMDSEDTDDELIYEVAKKACIPDESIHNMPFPITVEATAAAIKIADKIGVKRRAELNA